MPSYIDISVPLHENLPVWTGSHGIHISSLNAIARGDLANVSRLDIDIHSGTHIDAPLHFVEGGKTTAEIAIERFIGPCYVAEIKDKAIIGAKELEQAAIPDNVSRLLLKTDNSERWKDSSHRFFEDFSALSPEGAQWVADRGIDLIGIDYHSIQRFADPPDVHIILLEREIIILEGLNLRHIAPGAYELICLPIYIQGVEGASARAVLKTNP
ncbi:MAG: cyclase family protein [Saprospiraceae bacterium]|nr:cyclase family protein [Saprospiraceae bacterium]